MNYYISDLHFCDEAVMRSCNRPFNSAFEMDQILIQNWNSKVSESDHVYILGDIMGENVSGDLIDSYFCKLKGRLFYLQGNHDKDEFLEKKYFEDSKCMMNIKDKGRNVVLCHYPVCEWQFKEENGYMIHGHVHNKGESENFRMYYAMEEKLLNANVEINKYEPVTLEELIRNNENYKKNMF